jgi:hypothetical protein
MGLVGLPRADGLIMVAGSIPLHMCKAGWWNMVWAYTLFFFASRDFSFAYCLGLGCMEEIALIVVGAFYARWRASDCS